MVDQSSPHPDRDVVAPSPEARRLSFGAAAEDYDRFRPGYATDALRWGLGDRPLRVLDVGAGTGLLTEVVLRLGHDVVAVEPDPGMRARLEVRTAGRAAVLEGTAESIPLPDDHVDAVVVGQAFHWFQLDLALPELSRVLRGGGLLLVVWNVRNDDVGWVDQLSTLVGRLDARSGSRDEAVPRVGAFFAGLERAEFAHDQWLDADSLVGLVATYSYVRLSAQREDVLAQVRDLAEHHPDLVGRERFPLPYDTVVYRAAKAQETLRS